MENLRQKSIKLFFMKAAYGLKHKEAFKSLILSVTKSF